MTAADIIEALASVSDEPAAEIRQLAKRLRAAGQFPEPRAPAHWGHVATLVLAYLIGGPIKDAPAALDRVSGYVHTDSDGSATAYQFVREILRHLGTTDEADSLAVAGYRSTISVVDGDCRALVVRIGADDEPHEIAFTPGGRDWRPDWAEGVSTTRTLPGTLLWRLVARLRLLEQRRAA